RDVLETVPDAGIQPENSIEVDVTGDPGPDLGQPDAPGRGDVDQAGGEAGGQGVQEVLDRGRAVVLADEHGRMVRFDREGAFVGALLPDAEEAVDGTAVVSAGQPFVLGAELEARSRWRGLHRVEGGEQGRGVHAVA